MRLDPCLGVRARNALNARGSRALTRALLLGVCALLLFMARQAGAQTSSGTTPSTGTTTSGGMTLDVAHITRGGGYRKNASRKMWISYADCIGKPDNPDLANGDYFDFPITLTDTTHPLEVWAGNDDCPSKRGLVDPGQCWLVGGIDRPSRTQSVRVFARSVVARKIGATAVPAPDDANVCEGGSDPTGDQVTFYFLLEGGGKSIASVAWDGSAYGGTGFDLVGPEAPGSITVGLGESQLSVKIGDVQTDPDRDHYQVFCAPAGDLDAGPGGIIPGRSGTPDAGTLLITDYGDAGAPAACFTPLLVAGLRPNLNLSCGTATETSNSFSTDHLVNNTTYAIGVAADDILGNAGPLSQIRCGTPIPLNDFYEVYRQNGGRGGGGFCSAAPGLARFDSTRWLVLALGALAFAARRSRRARLGHGVAAPSSLVALIVAGGGLFTSSDASAQAANPTEPAAPHSPAAVGVSERPDDSNTGRDPTPIKVPEHKSDFSPQNMAFELRFGPYTPKLDQSANVPVQEGFFGKKKRFALGFEYDFQFWRAPHFGTLGAGAGWAYTQLSASNQIPEGVTVPPDSGPVLQKSNLNIMPMYAVGVVRIDVAARELHVPLVPYAKFGVGYALWWVTNGLGTARDADGKVGRGSSVGTQAALGAMFLLDILEPSAGVALDSETGINNSYLFFEWSMSNYSGQQANVGTNTWVTGLAFEL